MWEEGARINGTPGVPNNFPKWRMIQNVRNKKVFIPKLSHNWGLLLLLLLF